MQSNEYSSAYDDYNDYHQHGAEQDIDDAGMLIVEGADQAASSPVLLGGSTNTPDGMAGAGAENNANAIDFNDPKIASLPRILLMGPRRGGKTSIQVCIVLYECRIVLLKLFHVGMG